jgi:hypothetical protein
MKVDFKITTWESVSIPDERKDEVIEAIKNGEVENANDLIEKFDGVAAYEGIDDEVSSQMLVEENGGCSTIEVFLGEKKVFENGNE